ncbi:MAG: ATP-binding protein [Campylobacterales bacterium]|nr:ATP-binding protein [Campylobacterales bacterium]
MNLRLKLIGIFVLLKILPLLLIGYIALEGVKAVGSLYEKNLVKTLKKSEEVVANTADLTIQDSIHALDSKSQDSIEKMSVQIANQVAEFLYERDRDILFLSQIELNKKVLHQFYKSKVKEVTVHGSYNYDDKTSSWIPEDGISDVKVFTKADLKDNEKEFHKTKIQEVNKIRKPIYKEITYVNLKGKEIYKISSIEVKRKNISNRKNTYLKAEEYFSKIQNLKKGQIYVSEVIGEYVKTAMIGNYTKEKATKMNVPFDPKNSGYGGLENPVGKRYQGIIRLVTPVYKGSKKVGYLTMALDHTHVMEYTDYIQPTKNFITDISDPAGGNYAFMWDNKGRNISHARDYFITGFDGKTGERVPGWLSKDIAEEFKNSKETNLNRFLETYPTFQEQSLSKKPNIAQLVEEGSVGLDCRYLNFAPQCQGWMQLTKDGGYGSFVIYWSKVWKLTTAATIPYYTGQYGKTKRGFGFVTIGANVDEFHSAATKAKARVDETLSLQTKEMKKAVAKNKEQTVGRIEGILKNLSITTVFLILLMIIIAIWLADSVTKKIYILIDGAKAFGQKNFAHKIPIKSKDEFGELANAFNEMSKNIDQFVEKEKKQKEILKKEIDAAVGEIREKDAQILKNSRAGAIKEMMRRISHHWRQPLNVMNLHFAKIEVSTEDKEIIESAEIGQDLAQELSSTIDSFTEVFFNHDTKEDYSMIESINKAVSISTADLKEYGIEIETDCRTDVTLNGSSSEFSQVIMNIIENGKDSILEKDRKEKYLKIATKEEDGKIKISVEDSGTGFTDDALEKALEPYYSTKDQGQGDGLGLFMVKQVIIDGMGGEVDITNGEIGAIVTLTLNKK